MTCAGHGQSRDVTKHAARRVCSGWEKTDYRVQPLEREIHTSAPLEECLFSWKDRMNERKKDGDKQTEAAEAGRSSPLCVLHSQLHGQTLSAPRSAPNWIRTGKNVEITGNEAFCLSTTTFAEAPLNRLLGLLQPPERSGDVPPVREVRRGLPKAAGFVDGSLLTWRRR